MLPDRDQAASPITPSISGLSRSAKSIRRRGDHLDSGAERPSPQRGPCRPPGSSSRRGSTIRFEGARVGASLAVIETGSRPAWLRSPTPAPTPRSGRRGQLLRVVACRSEAAAGDAEIPCSADARGLPGCLVRTWSRPTAVHLDMDTGDYPAVYGKDVEHRPRCRWIRVSRLGVRSRVGERRWWSWLRMLVSFCGRHQPGENRGTRKR